MTNFLPIGDLIRQVFLFPLRSFKQVVECSTPTVSQMLADLPPSYQKAQGSSLIHVRPAVSGGDPNPLCGPTRFSFLVFRTFARLRELYYWAPLQGITTVVATPPVSRFAVGSEGAPTSVFEVPSNVISALLHFPTQASQSLFLL